MRRFMGFFAADLGPGHWRQAELLNDDDAAEVKIKPRARHCFESHSDRATSHNRRIGERLN